VVLSQERVLSQTAWFSFVAAISLGLAAPALAAVQGSARIPKLYRSCTNFNAKYRHGVGRVGIHDITRSGTDPLTTFRRSNRLYRSAISYNKGLDRDHDKIACEKH
jgi:hypothetical protein